MNLAGIIRHSTGLELSGADLERAVRERMQCTGVALRRDYQPRPGTPEFEALLDLVTVPESWMCRDPDVLEAALRFVQRRLLREPGRQVAVLSLPCAGGEEPYSLAMALAGAGISPGMCRIDALDLSRAALQRARLGRYTRNAFRGAGQSVQERWFRQDGDEYVIDDALRRYVSFGQGNLLALEPAITARRYDLVFCRNLLIYFDAAAREAAVTAIHGLLADDGLLLSGYAEAPVFCERGFAPQSLRAPCALYKVAAPAPAPRRVLDDRMPRTRPCSAGAVPVPPDARAPHELLDEVRRLADGGLLAEADRACRALLTGHADWAEAWFLLGLISECSGQPRAAERHWRRCVYLQPDHYEALCSLALLHELLGEASLGSSFRERAARVFERRAATSAGAPA